MFNIFLKERVQFFTFFPPLLKLGWTKKLTAYNFLIFYLTGKAQYFVFLFLRYVVIFYHFLNAVLFLNFK